MVKHRTSIEFPPDLWRELSVKVAERKKSKFIIDAIKDKLSKESLKALILCGGPGTDMRPLTLSMPKAMLPVGYKPLLERNLDFLKAHGINNFVFAIGYLGEQIIKYFGDGSLHGVRIQYSPEKEELGTAGAIKNADKLINSTFITMFCDTVFSGLDVKDALQFHKDKQALATVVMWRTNDVRNFGSVVADKDGAVEEFVEKPKHAAAGWINTGFFVFEPEIFNLIKGRGRVISLEEDIIPILMDRKKLFAYKHNGYWADVGNPKDYEKVNKDFLNDKIFSQ
jgi:NDP-sugar pyrophosphorylase family protein